MKGMVKMSQKEIKKYVNYVHKNKLLKEFCEFCSVPSRKGLETNELLKAFYTENTKERKGVEC